MKRFFLVILAAIVAMPLFFAACSSDSDDDGSGKPPFDIGAAVEGKHGVVVSVARNGTVTSKEIPSFVTMKKLSETEATFSLDPIMVESTGVEFTVRVRLMADKPEYILFESATRGVVSIGGVSTGYNVKGRFEQYNELTFEITTIPPFESSPAYYVYGSGSHGQQVEDPAALAAGDYRCSTDVEYPDGGYITESGLTITRKTNNTVDFTFPGLSFGHLGVYDILLSDVDIAGNTNTVTFNETFDAISAPLGDGAWRIINNVSINGAVSGPNIFCMLTAEDITISISGSRGSVEAQTLSEEVAGKYNMILSVEVPQGSGDVDASYSARVDDIDGQEIELSRIASAYAKTGEETINTLLNFDFTVTPPTTTDPDSGEVVKVDDFVVKLPGASCRNVLEGERGSVAILGTEQTVNITIVEKDGKDTKETEIQANLVYESGFVSMTHLFETSFKLVFTFKGVNYEISFSGSGAKKTEAR